MQDSEIRRIMWEAELDGRVKVCMTPEQTIELARTARDSKGERIVPAGLFYPAREIVATVDGEQLRLFSSVDGSLKVLGKPPKVALPKPKHNRALLVVAPDPRPRAELAISRRGLRRYAEYCEADYIELKDFPTASHPCANKYVLTQVSERYEQTLLVDTDIIIMPNVYPHCGNHRIGILRTTTGMMMVVVLNYSYHRYLYGIMSFHVLSLHL